MSTDPFHPSRSFDSITSDEMQGTIETAYADRALHFFRERPETAARLAVVRLIGEREKQVAFLKELPVERVEVEREVSPEEEAAADAVVRARRGEDEPGREPGPAPRPIERGRG